MKLVLIALGAVFAVCGGIGIVLLMFSSMLRSSNDTGRNTYDPKDYNTKVEFGMRAASDLWSDPDGLIKTRVARHKRLYAPDPGETVRILSPEELECIRAKSDEDHEVISDQYDLDGDLPPVDIPLFKPKD